MPTVQDYASAVYNLALVQGVSDSNPCVYQVRSGTDKYVVCATLEPTMALPLNVLWVTLVNSVPQMFRRTSKSSDGQHTFTWVQVTDYDSIFNTNQYWDPSDQPVPVIVSSGGGQLNASVYPVVKDNTAYTDGEAVPKSTVAYLIQLFKNSMLLMYQNMNNRVLSNASAIRVLQATSSSLSTRVTALETHIPNMLTASFADTDTWVIEHGFGAGMAVDIRCYTTDGDPVCPDRIVSIDGTASAVTFLLPLSGYVLATALPLAA